VPLENRWSVGVLLEDNDIGMVFGPCAYIERCLEYVPCVFPAVIVELTDDRESDRVLYIWDENTSSWVKENE
jgi:hypothetical protein